MTQIVSNYERLEVMVTSVLAKCSNMGTWQYCFHKQIDGQTT